MTDQEIEFFSNLPFPESIMFNFVACILHEFAVRFPERIDVIDEAFTDIYEKMSVLNPERRFQYLVEMQDKIDKELMSGPYTYGYDANSETWVVYKRDMDKLVEEIQKELK